MATTPALSSPGIGSGLDVNAIVSKLMAVEQLPLATLVTKATLNQTRISAFGSLKGALSSLQNTLALLTTPGGFQSLSASVTDIAVAKASVGTGASAGNYSIEVSKLAQAQKLASGGFASTTTLVGSGTLTFDFGTATGGAFTSNGSGAKSVTIAPGADSLASIRDAVNAANVGVSASIVNDGSAAGNRLVFTSNASGAANSLRIAVSDTDGNATDTAGLSQLAYDPAAAIGAGRNLTEKVAAQNSEFLLDGIAISKASNTVSDAIQGVTLTLTKTNVGSPVGVSVAASPDGVAKSLASFVQAYNTLDATFDNLTKYDAANQKPSSLTGDSTVRSIQSQMRALLGSSLPSGTYTSLSQVGFSFQTDGTIKLDNAKLNAALGSNPDGVAQLFAAVGTATDSLVGVAGFGAQTQAGSYAIAVTQLATRGNLAGSAVADLAIVAG
ncbi:MAG: flagellar filament capping protein FliD, partial [Betaproteobacteria bacterium]